MSEIETIKKDQTTDQYRSMAKGTAMMGGVQVFNIIINLIRGKLVATLLGPTGMGIMSLFQSSGNMLQQISSLGLNLSTVKEIANDKENGGTVISVVRKLLLITAILGAILTILFSPLLSKFSFGNSNYTLSYTLLSLMVLFMTLSNGELAILQGGHAMKRLALSTLIGSSIGLCIGVPLYYFFGEKGIVPSLIISALALYVFYYYHSLKEFGHVKCRVKLLDNKELAGKLLSLGVIFMLSGVFGTITTYLVNAFIRNFGSINDVGLFQAANSLTNQYAALVFSAMAMDFFPRLSAVSSDNCKIRNLVNSQTELIVLTIAPLASVVIIFCPLIVRILLTESFLVIVPVIRCMAIGIFFKAIAYPMGYISFSKGDKKTFFWLEGVFSNVNHLLLYVIVYYYWGILGLGYAMIISYVFFISIYFILTKKLYDYTPERDLIKIIIPLLLGLSIILLSSYIGNIFLSYSIMSIFALSILIFCIIRLNKRLNLKELIRSNLCKY